MLREFFSPSLTLLLFCGNSSSLWETERIFSQVPNSLNVYKDFEKDFHSADTKEITLVWGLQELVDKYNHSRQKKRSSIPSSSLEKLLHLSCK